MRVIIVKPEERPVVADIDPGLESLQSVVGGYIEAVYPWEDPVALICNEEGKMSNLPLNRALRDEHGEIYDILAGTFIVAGLTEDDFGDLTDEQVERYMKRFHDKECFLSFGSRIIAVTD